MRVAILAALLTLSVQANANCFLPGTMVRFIPGSRYASEESGCGQVSVTLCEGGDFGCVSFPDAELVHFVSFWCHYTDVELCHKTTPAPTPAPTSASPHQCTSVGPRRCSHLASFSLLDEVAAYRNDQEARECMSSGMNAVTREVSNTCTLSQVQGSPPCGTECWPILKPKILSVQSWCLEKKYSGLERYNKCLLEHGCDKPLAVECRDTDHGRGDRYGDPCYRYSTYPSWCGGYDTGDFHSYSMCCACGGGDWACPDQSAADVMKVQGALDVMEGYLSNISVKLSQTAPESPMPMTHANNETLFLTLAFTSGALTAIMVGVITLRRLKGKRSSAAGHLLA